MYVTPRQKRNTLIKVLLLALAIPFSVATMYIAIRFFSNAGNSDEPKNVVVSNITYSSATISWITETKTAGTAKILTPKEGAVVADRRGTGSYSTHFIEFTNLESDTEYTFEILSGSEKYKHASFKFRTAPLNQTSPPTPAPAFGQVSGNSDAIVFIYAPGSNLLSTVTSPNGSWLIDLSALYTKDLSKQFSLSSSTTLNIIALSNDGGAFVKGPYKELFNSEGKFISSTPLAINTGTDVLSKLDNSYILARSLSSNVPNNGNTTSSSTSSHSPVRPQPSAPASSASHNGSSSSDNDSSTGSSDFTNSFDSVDMDIDGEQEGSASVPVLTWGDIPIPESAVISDSKNSNVKYDADSLMITNHTDVSFTIVWRTKTQKQGVVRYGQNAGDLSNIANDIRDSLIETGRYYMHVVEVRNLLPDTKYYYEVSSGEGDDEEIFRDGSQPFEITTFKTLNSPPPFESIGGQVTTEASASEVVIVVHAVKDGKQSTLVSTVPSDDLSWTLNIGDLRTEDGSDYFAHDNSDTLNIVAHVKDSSVEVSDLIGNLKNQDVDINIKSSGTTIDYSKLLLNKEEYNIH